MRSVNFILASISLVLSSCKKETVKSVSEKPETSCICLKENIGIEIPDRVTCYGFLTMTNYIDLTREMPFSYVSTNAYFNSMGDLQISGNSTVTVDSVCLNQQALKSIKDANGTHMYYQNDYASWPSQGWSIYGANGVPTFTFSADLKNPVADFSLLPDNISKSLVKSFKINGVTNRTNGFVMISSADQSGIGVLVILREGSNEICFPEEQLKQVSTGKANLLIVLENTMTKTFSNKNFMFSKNLQYQKTITLNP